MQDSQASESDLMTPFEMVSSEDYPPFRKFALGNLAFGKEIISMVTAFFIEVKLLFVFLLVSESRR